MKKSSPLIGSKEELRMRFVKGSQMVRKRLGEDSLKIFCSQAHTAPFAQRTGEHAAGERSAGSFVPAVRRRPLRADRSADCV